MPSSSNHQTHHREASPPHKHHRVHDMLAALSFEQIFHHHPHDHGRPHGWNNPHNSQHSNDSEALQTTAPESESSRRTLPSKHALTKLGSKRTKRRSSAHLQVNHMMHGTLDPEGHVEDVFYDALQFGDHPDNPDEFKVVHLRESITIPSILVDADAIEAYIQHNYQNDSSLHEDGDTSESVSPLSPYPTVINDRTTESGWSRPSAPPPPPDELPLRFLRAGKGDVAEGLRRYHATLQWRANLGMDTILREPNEDFDLIKSHYPAFYHGRAKSGQPVFFECPPRTNLKALRRGGVSLEKLLRYYAMLTEFGWQYVERDDLARSVYVIDLQGMRLGDFVGEVIDFVKKASAFTSQHYPERAGYVMVINVPSWFKLIWNVVKSFVDEVTLDKISILRGSAEIQARMRELISVENIPSEYGGISTTPLGESKEEHLLRDLIRHNNALAKVAKGEEYTVCNGAHGNPPCRFCSWVPARSY
jgi:hypothetical protein